MTKSLFDPRRFLGRVRGGRRACRPARPNPLAAGLEQLEGRALLTLPTHGALAYGITHSDEYYTSHDIAPDFGFLGRAPDAYDLSYYLKELHQGVSDEQLLAGFTGSQEFYIASGNTPDSWVKAMYKDILNRQPSPDEVTAYVNYLNAGGPRNGVALGFAYSFEHESQVVTFDYGKYLDRGPTPNELSAGVKAIQGGETNETFVASLVGSTEFSQLHDQADANFVRAAYQRVQSRLPQAYELAYDVGLLEGTGPVNVPGSAVYNVTVSGSVNGGPAFTQQGIAGVVKLGPFGVPTTNSEDFGLELGNPPTASTSGSLLFASDRALFSVLDRSSTPMPLLLAHTTVNANSGAFSVNVDPSVNNTGTQQNEFNLATKSGNVIYLVSQGTVSLQFAPGGASFSGTIQLHGHVKGSSALVPYTANFSGTLV